MTDPKPFASLSPTLLARKGAARPAMRPQLQPLHHFREATARQIEDLGWNDMGHDSHEANGHASEHAPEPLGEPEVAAPDPAESADVVALNPETAVPAAEVPAVVRQQDAIAERVAAPAKLAKPAKPAKAAARRQRRSALEDGRRAAFTLRLDSERHLQLRLACTVGNRSAQQIVTEALDQFLSSRPELASLAAQVGKRR